jgi:hypothetical protein
MMQLQETSIQNKLYKRIQDGVIDVWIILHYTFDFIILFLLFLLSYYYVL